MPIWLVLFCRNQRKIKTFSLWLCRSPTLSLSNFCLSKWWASLVPFEACCKERSLCEAFFFSSLFDITELWSHLNKIYICSIYNVKQYFFYYMCTCDMPAKVSTSQIQVRLPIRTHLLDTCQNGKRLFKRKWKLYDNGKCHILAMMLRSSFHMMTL